MAFHENIDREDMLRMQSMGRADLMVIMPPDERLVRDILMYKRTEKYIRQNISITQQDAIKRILTDKNFQNQERYADLQQHISSLLGKAKLFVKETASAFENQLQELTNLAEQTAQYPFLAVLEQPMERLRGLADKSYTFYLTELGRQEDSLLDQKENILDPVRRFMSGPMKGLYDEARKFLQSQEPNFTYVGGDEAQRIQDTLNDAACFKGNRMQQAKALVDALKAKVTEQLQQERAKAAESITSLKERMESMEEFKTLSSEQQGQLIQPFDQFIQGLERLTLIAVIRDTLRRFEEEEHQRLLRKMSAWAQPKPGTGTIAESKVEYVTSRSIRVPFANPGWRMNRMWTATSPP